MENTEDELAQAEKLIAENELDAAQKILDGVKEKSARRYFVQGKLYEKKGWHNEARKQLKKAVKAEPENERYADALDDLEIRAKKNGFLNDPNAEDKATCAFCCAECACEACATSICEGCG